MYYRYVTSVRSKITITVNDLPLVVVRWVSARCRNWMLRRFWLRLLLGCLGARKG